MNPDFRPSIPPEGFPPQGIDKILIIVCHLSVFIGFPIIFPLVLYLAKKRENPRVADHAKEVLNFHLSLFFYGLLCIPLFFILIGFALLALIALLGAICALLAALKASDDGFFRYPLTIRLIS